jgi:hypothetical protein
MTDRQAMLEAHVQFEMARWVGDNLHTTLETETGALFDWLGTVRLHEVVSAAELHAWMRRVLVETPLTAATGASLKESVLVAYEFLQEDATPLKALLPRPLFDRVVAHASQLDGLRREITHQVVTSSVYTLLISNVLYHGIKGFVLTENALTQKIPGAASLLKFGQNAMSAASPQMERKIDAQLVHFIHDNLQETIRESERFLNDALDEGELHKVADEIWATNAPAPVSKFAGHLHGAAFDAFVDIAVDFWLHLRTTPFFADLLAQIVHNLYLQHGKKPIAALLTEVGITPAAAVAAIHPLAAAWIARTLEDGYLEARIRQRLGAFYASYAAPTTR